MSSFVCAFVGGAGVICRGECEMRLVEDDTTVRSGVRIVLSRVLSAVNGEAALDGSIVNAMSSISEMLCCLKDELSNDILLTICFAV
jgi:hypothetical protein